MTTAESIWMRPERSAVGRPAQWSRAQITEIALRVADADGLDAVSMRRVAAELGLDAITNRPRLRAAVVPGALPRGVTWGRGTSRSWGTRRRWPCSR